MVVDRSRGETRICSISKSGGVVIGPQQMKQFMAVAEKRWDEFRAVIEQRSDTQMTLS